MPCFACGLYFSIWGPGPDGRGPAVWYPADQMPLAAFTDTSLPRVLWYNYKWYLNYCQHCNQAKLRADAAKAQAAQRMMTFERQ